MSGTAVERGTRELRISLSGPPQSLFVLPAGQTKAVSARARGRAWTTSLSIRSGSLRPPHRLRAAPCGRRAWWRSGNDSGITGHTIHGSRQGSFVVVRCVGETAPAVVPVARRGAVRRGRDASRPCRARLGDASNHAGHPRSSRPRSLGRDKTLMARPATPPHESGPTSRSGLSWERGHLARMDNRGPSARCGPEARAPGKTAQTYFHGKECPCGSRVQAGAQESARVLRTLGIPPG